MRVSTLPLFALLFIAALLQITPASAQTPDNLQIGGKYGNMHIPSTVSGSVVFTGRNSGNYYGDFIFRNYTGGDADFSNGAYYTAPVFHIIGKTGFVGIGTSAPATKLHVNLGRIRIAQSDGANSSGVLELSNGSAINYLFTDGATGNLFLRAPGKHIFLDNGGSVAIGATNPLPAGYRLVVKGSILSEEVKVQLADFWPDYVFKPTYQLKPLSEVATYIRLNGHLPNIPSAAQVAQDGGIKVGEMNARLLEKVEELTLYLIEQQKQMERLQAEISQLKAAGKN